MPDPIIEPTTIAVRAKRVSFWVNSHLSRQPFAYLDPLIGGGAWK